jgi:mRNA interferase HigB
MMRVIKRLPLVEFGKKHPRAIEPLADWYDYTRAAIWHSFADVKRTFGQTDQAKVASGQTICIFDIGGNKFRLIAFVSYNKGKVYALRVLTHKEYDTDKWKKEL